MTADVPRGSEESHRQGMLAAADRLLAEFPDIPLVEIAEAMRAARGETPEGCEPARPDAVYRLARAMLADAACR